MDEIIMAPNFGGICLVILVFLGIIYAFIVAFEEYVDGDFDPVIEARCKKCIMYDVCRKHGTDYNCKDYMTEEMLQKKCMNKDEFKRG